MDYFDSHILETLIYLSMLTAVGMMAIPRRHADLVRVFAVGSGALLLAGSVYTFAAFDYREGAEQYQMLRTYEWMESLGIDLRLGVDGIAALMVLLTGVVIFTATLVSWNIERINKNFFVLLFTLVAGARQKITMATRSRRKRAVSRFIVTDVVGDL